MQTQTIYSALVNRRKTPPATGRVEKHHIVPKSLGGSDHKSNLVSLTPREHYVAHRLLAKMHGGPMWAALAFMSRGAVNSAAGVVVPSRVYALAKQKDAEWRVDRYKGEGNPFYGKTFTEEQLVKLRGKRVSVEGKNNPNYGVHDEDRNAIISFVISYNPRAVTVDDTVQRRIDSQYQITDELRRLNKFYSFSAAARAKAETRDYTGVNNPNHGNGAAISGEKNPMYGRKHGASTKAKIAAKAARKLTCPHCGKVANIGNAKRWHFGNCKQAT